MNRFPNPERENKTDYIIDSLIDGYSTTEREGIDVGKWNSIENRRPKNHFELTGLETSSGDLSVLTDFGGPGSKYERNEDSVLVLSNNEELVVGVIDGAGGSDDGALVSTLVNLSLGRSFEQKKTTTDSLSEANWLARQYSPGCYAVGTFLRVEKEDGVNKVEVSGLGDSRVLTLRDGDIFNLGTTWFQNEAWNDVMQSTGDYSNPESLRDYFLHPRTHLILGGFGITDQLFGDHRYAKPVIKNFVGRPGDVIILASDGIWDVVSDVEIKDLLAGGDLKADDIKEKIFSLAFERNNAKGALISIDCGSGIRAQKILKKGDNISLAVLVLD